MKYEEKGRRMGPIQKRRLMTDSEEKGRRMGPIQKRRREGWDRYRKECWGEIHSFIHSEKDGTDTGDKVGTH